MRRNCLERSTTFSYALASNLGSCAGGTWYPRSSNWRTLGNLTLSSAAARTTAGWTFSSSDRNLAAIVAVKLKRVVILFITLFATVLCWGNTYRTTFPATENPISEGSNWVNGQTAGGNLWGNVQSKPGLAFGVSLPTPYGDPTAILTGTWGPNQYVRATVKINTVRNGCCDEVEVRLRSTISANSITGYEILCPVHPDTGYGFQVVRWNGPNGQYVIIGGGAGVHHCVDGEVIEATVSGTNPSTIKVYDNGALIITACDNGQASGGSCGGATYSGPGGAAGPWTSGNPGIGFFDGGNNNWNFFGLSSFDATDNPPEPPTGLAAHAR